MKQPKKPTRVQKEIMHNNGLIPSNWQVVEEREFYLRVVSKDSGRFRTINKYAGKKKGA